MAEQAVREYLHELDQELRDLPRSRRQELLGEIHEHIDSALAEAPVHDEAKVRNVLDRLGDPADIAEEARQRFGVPRERAGGYEIWALILLLVGGVVIPVIGWIPGVILLWSSRAWTTREKLAGTFLFPFGLLLPVALLLGAAGVRECSGVVVNGQVVDQTCSGSSVLYEAVAIVGLAILVIVPIVTTIVLARRMRARTASA